jgi:hypothetical protein
LQKQLFTPSGSDLTVRNLMGQDVVRVSGNAFSFSGRTMIRGVDGSPIVDIRLKSFGFGKTDYLTNPKTETGKVIATARYCPGIHPKIELYEGEAYYQPTSLMMTLGGDFFLMTGSGCGAGPLSTRTNQCVAKAIRTGGGLSFLPETSMVNVAAGFDSTLILALAVVVQACTDQSRRRRRRS